MTFFFLFPFFFFLSFFLSSFLSFLSLSFQYSWLLDDLELFFPLLLGSSTAWMLGRTPPAAMVTWPSLL